MLLSFTPVPGTVFFAGYGSTMAETESFKFSDFRRRTDGFFLKASYLFRLGDETQSLGLISQYRRLVGWGPGPARQRVRMVRGEAISPRLEGHPRRPS